MCVTCNAQSASSDIAHASACAHSCAHSCVSYEEEDTCVSYAEEDTCSPPTSAYEEKDTCVSYAEEDNVHTVVHTHKHLLGMK
jgi:hypothetical protein